MKYGIIFYLLMLLIGFILGAVSSKSPTDNANRVIYIQSIPVEKWFPSIENEQELQFAIRIMDNFLEHKQIANQEAWYITEQIEQYQNKIRSIENDYRKNQ